MSNELNINSQNNLEQIERSLKERNDLLNSIFSAASMGIGIAKNRVIKEVNPFLCDMLGYEPGELIGKSGRMVYPSDEEFNKAGNVQVQTDQCHGIRYC
jgi:PAS domain S-box-containing protein